MHWLNKSDILSRSIKYVNNSPLNIFLNIWGQWHILECEVKWALGRLTTNKASGGDGIPAELFQIL